MKTIWVFNGGGRFPSGVFSTRENAEIWIGKFASGHVHFHYRDGCRSGQ